ncbi:30S ribosomal protein S3 [Fructilactobacillus hinvesii]|uniref:Small ribosomal subunit protein uS3 n=1 Tax=Fructilactobacillus hinvesii TaxID=2940300 RepID=A0ABY5BWU9_9LACO|nr:30S ribosomal protein S3 [Fructilactobacillus hinvesii]USS88461.1 30S ribosomal protein S3 [Fructilactobacillus hinvesii]
MGQKINPNGLRIGVTRGWQAQWFANDDKFASYLNEDLKIRGYLEKRLADASVSEIDIERAAKRVNISIHTAKPGMVIGKGGSEVESLRQALNKLTGRRVHINIVEIKKPDLEADLVGENIARQLEGRVAFRRAMRGAMKGVMRSGATGVKTQSAGRLNGADMARIESYSEGRVPLHTLRADIDYSWNEAHTTYGSIGVKTWINRGEVLPDKPEENRKGGK